MFPAGHVHGVFPDKDNMDTIPACSGIREQRQYGRRAPTDNVFLPQPKIVKNREKKTLLEVRLSERGSCCTLQAAHVLGLCHLRVLPLFPLHPFQLDSLSLPVHSLPAASLLPLLFQHYGWWHFYCCPFQQQRSMVVLQTEQEKRWPVTPGWCWHLPRTRQNGPIPKGSPSFTAETMCPAMMRVSIE